MEEYEFNDAQNRIFLKFLLILILLSVSLFFTGMVTLIQGIIPNRETGDIVTGIVFIVISVSLLFPTRNFMNIITTSGNDIKEFMKGLSSLNFGFNFIAGATSILLVTILVSFISGFF